MTSLYRASLQRYLILGQSETPVCGLILSAQDVRVVVGRRVVVKIFPNGQQRPCEVRQRLPSGQGRPSAHATIRLLLWKLDDTYDQRCHLVGIVVQKLPKLRAIIEAA